MKAAIIGNGYISKNHREGFAELKQEGSDIELVALCDIRPEMLEKNSGERLYTDPDEMLAAEKDLDFAIICLPTFLHAEYAIKCMRAGLHVLCEKPMALTVAEAEAMLACAKETGKKLMVAHCCRFDNERLAVKEFVDAGSFGKPVSAVFTATGGQPRWGYENWFADEKRSGACMLDLQAHNLDLINWFFGVPDSTCTMAKQCCPDFTGYGTVYSNLAYDNGLMVFSYCDWGVPVNKNQARILRINFEKGYIYLDRAVSPQVTAVGYDGSVTEIKTSHPFPSNHQFRCEIEYFANCIKNDIHPDFCPPEASEMAIAVMRAQEASADGKGTLVRIEK